MAYYSRNKNKIQNPYTMPDMYQDYLSKVEVNTPYDLPYNIYKDIVCLYNKKLYNNLLDGHKVKFPYKLGSLQVIKKKMNFNNQLKYRMGIDWANTVKYGKVIHHINEHTDGYKFLFFWDIKSKPTVKTANKYRLKPTRTLKRELAKLIIKSKKDYFER